ncbi:MAG: hypothetical protein ABI855_20155 [Bacteroidota bacterium]
MKTKNIKKPKCTYEKPLKLKGRFIDILDAALGKEVHAPKKQNEKK